MEIRNFSSGVKKIFHSFQHSRNFVSPRSHVISSMYHSFISIIFPFFLHFAWFFFDPLIQGGLKHHEEEVVSYFSDDPSSVMITNIPSRCVHS